MPNASQQTPFRSVSVSLSRADIIEFAQQFDPQPYHLDAEAAEQSIFGALCASGWQVAALTTRLLEDALVDEGLDVLYTNEVSSAMEEANVCRRPTCAKHYPARSRFNLGTHRPLPSSN